MGLFSKIKNILFEEEEIEVPAKEIKKAEKIEEVSEEEPERIEKLEKAKQVVDDSPSITVFDKEPTFNFPDFDEDEFENTLPKYKEEVKEKEEPEQRLVREHQRELKKEEPKKEELRHKSDLRSIGRGYSPLDKSLKDGAPKKFVPSPIISPVYGILDKDYHPDDISTREDTDLKRSNKLDVDTVRKKAFEPVEEKPKPEPKKEEEKKEEVKPEPIEEVETKPIEEPKKAKKSVDELLADSAEEIIAVDENLNVENNIKEIEDELDKIDDELVLDEKPKTKDEDDTLEQDLFELIDSMYEDDKEED